MTISAGSVSLTLEGHYYVLLVARGAVWGSVPRCCLTPVKGMGVDEEHAERTYLSVPSIRRDWFDSEDISRINSRPVVNNRVRMPLAELL